MGGCLSVSTNNQASGSQHVRRSSNNQQSQNGRYTETRPSAPSMPSGMSLTRNNSFRYQNSGQEGKICAVSSVSKDSHILTTYSRINTPKGRAAGQVVQNDSRLHGSDLHYNNDPGRGNHYHNSYPSRSSLLNAIRSTDLHYEAETIENNLRR